MAKERNTDAVEAGARLRATRLALGYQTIRRLAQLTDVPESNLTKWESGAAMVRTYFIARLRERHGVTHDWIYGGIKAGLPHDLVLKLEATEPAD